MREIKFRGKRPDNSGWVYGDLITWDSTYIHTRENNLSADQMLFGESLYRVIPETVGQFTEYKMGHDEVFDHDLVSNNFKTDKEVIREIIQYEGNWVMKRIKGNSRLPKYISLHEFYNLNYKVIGNIHEVKK